jgi:hypothetical protein
MKIFYDCEFIENGTTIDLISIGMVTSDGREYYAVSEEFDHQALLGNPWLVENVLPVAAVRALPGATWPATPGTCTWTTTTRTGGRSSLAGVSPTRLVTSSSPSTPVPDPELWAWYGAYDHVALCQLWGPMIALPGGIPMFTCDLKQEAVRQGDPRVCPTSRPACTTRWPTPGTTWCAPVRWG